MGAGGRVGGGWEDGIGSGGGGVGVVTVPFIWFVG